MKKMLDLTVVLIFFLLRKKIKDLLNPITISLFSGLFVVLKYDMFGLGGVDPLVDWKIFGIEKNISKFEDEKYPYIMSNSPEVTEINSFDNKYSTIIGVDFGTIKSGYAFTFLGNPNIFRDNGKSFSDFVISRNHQNELHHSETSLVSMMNYKPSELANIIFIKGLKALLSSENNTINDNICFIYPESQIHKINISKAITSYFTLLKEEIIDRVDEYSKLHNGHLVDEQKILWIFTIPAFWSEFIKQLLKKSFEEKNIEHFKIIYESEAEALSIYDNEYINSYYKKKDKVFMIIDAGGNSFDISIYEIIDNNGSMKELKGTISYNFGIIKISEEIINIIENIAGKNEIKKMKQNNPGEWIKTSKDIIQAIEKTYILEGNVEIEISSSFSKFIKPNDYNIRGKTFSLLFPSNIIEKITINMLIKFEEKLENLFENLKKENIYINNVLFTGGFSQNQYFKKRMNNYFDKKRIYYNYITSYQNIIPKGSILFAKDPSKIQSRISPVTIGIKKLTFDDKMEIILKKNEIIKNTLSKTIYIQPEKDFQDIIQINIYLTNKDIINEENLLNFYFGRLLLRIENTDKIQITFIYDTHLSFKAKDKEGKEINTEFQFFK